jgi:hypothetical protein
MRINMLAKLGEVLTLSFGVRLVVSDLDVESSGNVSYREWVKFCPLVPTADPDHVLRSDRDYENSFEVMVTVDRYGARVSGVGVPEEYRREIEQHFLEHHRIPSMLRNCYPYQQRLRAEASGVQLSLADGWV